MSILGSAVLPYAVGKVFIVFMCVFLCLFGL